jgi:hypothetical protein
MLLFELFPAFVAIVSVVAGIWLFLADRQARREEAHDGQRTGDLRVNDERATTASTPPPASTGKG